MAEKGRERPIDLEKRVLIDRDDDEGGGEDDEDGGAAAALRRIAAGHDEHTEDAERDGAEGEVVVRDGVRELETGDHRPGDRDGGGDQRQPAGAELRVARQ